jgi:magnesium transporter
VLAELDEANAEAILCAMEPETAREARHLLSYAPDTAGGLMVTDLLRYDEKRRVSEVTAPGTRRWR